MPKKFHHLKALFQHVQQYDEGYESNNKQKKEVHILENLPVTKLWHLGRNATAKKYKL